jgi:hypothetical protein
MASEEGRIAWVLGAGFSRPLGLPLAKDLFTDRYLSLATGFLQSGFAEPGRVLGYLNEALNPVRLALGEASKAYNRGEVPNPISFDYGCGRALDVLTSVAQPLSESLSGPDEVTHYLGSIESCRADVQAFIEAVTEFERKREGDRHAANDALGRAMKAHGAVVAPFRNAPQADAQKHGTTVLRKIDSAVREIRDVSKLLADVYEPSQWTAEMILVSLDKAARGNPTEQSFWEKKVTRRVDIVHRCKEALNAATRLIVAELEFAIPMGATIETAGSIWKPYQRWARELFKPQDHIVCFNYDRVVEKSFELAESTVPSTLLKLHGSVTTTLVDGAPVEIRVSELHAKLRGFERSFNVHLGLPGESKDRLHVQGQPLDQLWDRARDGLATADTVVFLGYRLPPEDTESEMMIVDALRDRETKPRAYLVLGPGQQEAERMRTILAPLVSEVEAGGLWTEDALIGWRREQLIGKQGRFAFV